MFSNFAEFADPLPCLPLASIHASTRVPVDVNRTSKNKTTAAYYDDSEVLRSTFLVVLPMFRLAWTAESTCLDADWLNVNFVLPSTQ